MLLYTAVKQRQLLQSVKGLVLEESEEHVTAFSQTTQSDHMNGRKKQPSLVQLFMHNAMMQQTDRLQWSLRNQPDLSSEAMCKAPQPAPDLLRDHRICPGIFDLIVWRRNPRQHA